VQLLKITLISHASVIVETKSTRIITDPWFFGKAFNDSWSLNPAAAWNPEQLDGIDYMWISHEHPDHFHVPTLKSLPEAFKKRVTILFQLNNSDKMFDAFRRLGYTNLKALPHRKLVPLSDDTKVYCYQEGQMNSCLAVRDGEDTLLNVNDAEIRVPDCRLIRRDIGDSKIVLNQFSIAGYNGLPERDKRLSQLAQTILDNMVDNHRDLGAEVTIPFASLIYFSTTDNRYMNRFANKPADVVRRFDAAGLATAILYPGDSFQLGSPYDSSLALERYARDASGLDTLAYNTPKKMEIDQIRAAFEKLHMHIRERYPATMLRILKPVIIEIPDVGLSIEFTLRTGQLRKVPPDTQAHLVVYSQPLHFAFSFPYGVQTLGVSARFSLLGGVRNWQLHRILFAMNNAELYLQPRYLFKMRNLAYVTQRLRGGPSQVWRRLSTMT
jgi:hypothetical protein